MTSKIYTIEIDNCEPYEDHYSWIIDEYFINFKDAEEWLDSNGYMQKESMWRGGYFYRHIRNGMSAEIRELELYKPKNPKLDTIEKYKHLPIASYEKVGKNYGYDITLDKKHKGIAIAEDTKLHTVADQHVIESFESAVEMCQKIVEIFNDNKVNDCEVEMVYIVDDYYDYSNEWAYSINPVEGKDELSKSLGFEELKGVDDETLVDVVMDAIDDVRRWNS